MNALTQTVCGESAKKPKLLLILSVCLSLCRSVRVSFSRLLSVTLSWAQNNCSRTSHQTQPSATGPLTFTLLCVVTLESDCLVCCYKIFTLTFKLLVFEFQLRFCFLNVCYTKECYRKKISMLCWDSGTKERWGKVTSQRLIRCILIN